MEKRISITGVTFEELTLALGLCYKMFFESHRKECRGVTAYNVLRFPASQESASEDIEELHLYSSYQPTENALNLPNVISEGTLASLIWDYLKKFEKADLDTDGSLGRGWSILAGSPLYGDSRLNDRPNIVVRFTTMVYGK